MQRKSWNTLKERLPRAEYIEAYAKKVVKNEKPAGIILFGSVAKGNAVEESDIDIVVIYDEAIDFKDKSLVLRELDEVGLIEPFPYGHAQVERMLQDANGFMLDVFSDGVVLFEKGEKIKGLFKLKDDIVKRFDIRRVERGWDVGVTA